MRVKSLKKCDHEVCAGLVHVKVAMALLLCTYWLFWFCGARSVLHYEHVLVDNELQTAVGVLVGVAVLLITVSVSVSYLIPTLIIPFMILQTLVLFANTTAITFVVQRLRFNDVNEVMVLVAWIAFWVATIYGFHVTIIYRGWAFHEQKINGYRSSNMIKVFRERVFGTPPTEAGRMELERGLCCSDSHIDDIFGDDYQEHVTLI